MNNSSVPEDTRFLKTYDIAQPKTYPSFSPSETRVSAALEGTTRTPEPRRFDKDWDDTGKPMPLDEAGKKREPAGIAKAEISHGGREARAVWIVHGMGQQIPFETVDSLAQGVLSVAKPPGIKPRLRTVQLGNQTVQRVELDVDSVATDPNGNPEKQYELHLYETYWAPETEGVAKLSDVISFLLDGGSRGILNSFHAFRRAMFGTTESFKIPLRSPLSIGVTLAVLFALMAINAVIVLAAASFTKAAAFTSLRLDLVWPQLTALAGGMTAVAFTFGTVLFLADESKPSRVPRALRVAISTLVWLALIHTILVILATAVIMTGTIHKLFVPAWFSAMHPEQVQTIVTLAGIACLILIALTMARRAYLRSSEHRANADVLSLFLFGMSFCLHIALLVILGRLLCGHQFSVEMPAPLGSILASPKWVWPFLIVLAQQVRTLLVEYVGDVAIYITPNKLDRFDRVRNEIKQTALNVASAIFLACDPEKKDFLYDQIAVVGHSLGSVIAYDTLNQLMLNDWLSNNHLGIANRTNCLLTFGSPLDKTAFLFTIQGTNSMHIRERLAATVQPIIQSYQKFRKFRWINVHSGNDIISGKLTFYDLPKMQDPKEVPPEAVHNVVDKDASIPLLAHVEYWKNQTTWIELMQQIAP
jgi:hypothetical protein